MLTVDRKREKSPVYRPQKPQEPAVEGQRRSTRLQFKRQNKTVERDDDFTADETSDGEFESSDEEDLCRPKRRRRRKYSNADNRLQQANDADRQKTVNNSNERQDPVVCCGDDDDSRTAPTTTDTVATAGSGPRPAGVLMVPVYSTMSADGSTSELTVAAGQSPLVVVPPNALQSLFEQMPWLAKGMMAGTDGQTSSGVVFNQSAVESLPGPMDVSESIHVKHDVN